MGKARKADIADDLLFQHRDHLQRHIIGSAQFLNEFMLVVLPEGMDHQHRQRHVIFRGGFANFQQISVLTL